MHDYKDLKRLTKVATVILGIYLLLDLIASAGAVIEGPAPTGVARASDFVALVELVALITSFCVVGRWIYRASANAHGLSDYLSISPGWAVGWYFIPIMNLFRPFQAMKEIWFASHESDGGYEERAPAILSAWWGLWIVNNVLGNISFRLSMAGGADTSISDGIDLISALVNIPLCLVLIIIMREVSSSQRSAMHAQAFA